MGHSRRPSQTFLKRGGKAPDTRPVTTAHHDGQYFFGSRLDGRQDRSCDRGAVRCQLFKNFQKSIVMQCFLGWRTVKTGRVTGSAVTTAVKKFVVFFYYGLFIYLLQCWYVFSPLWFHVSFVSPLHHASETIHKMEVHADSENLTFSVHVPDDLFLADKERVHVNQFIPALW